MDDGSRARVELKLDRRLLKQAEVAGLDVPALVEGALREALRAARYTPLTEAEREGVRRGIAWRNAMIDKEGLFGQEWRTF
jgi:post-segregation antitoxin (ccd killing protein)